MHMDDRQAEDPEPRSEGAGEGIRDQWKVELEEEGVLSVRTPLVPLIDEKDRYIVLGRSSSAHKKWRRKGCLEIGAVGEHQETGNDLFGKKVYLDAAFPHIIFICGKRGSGKSYTLGIFAEELMRSAIGVGVIMIDPIGIFWSLKEENRTMREKKILERWGLEPHSFPEVKVLIPEGSVGHTSGVTDGIFSIGVGEMAAEDWCQVFDVDRFKTQGLLIGSAIEQVRKGYDSVNEGRIEHIPGRNGTYSIGDIIQCIETSLVLTSKTGGFTVQTRRSIIARFNAAAGWGIFSVEGTPLREITSSNRATVLDVSDPRLGDEKRSLITGVIARKILSARIHSARIEERDTYDELDPDLIPVTWLLIDEAHVILPHKGQTPATEALVEYAKQGRRPGCALVLATQRPASTSDEILSQVDLLIGHNLALEDDMTALRRRVPAKLPSEFANSDFIRAIPVGTAIMADQRTQQRSFLLKLRPRFSHHAGSSAMPKAFIEKIQKPARPVPISGSYDKAHDPSKVNEPTPVPEKEPEREERSREFGLAPGQSIMVRDESKELMVQVLDSVEKGLPCILFSRMPPKHYPIGSSLNIERSFWLSSTPGDDVIAPTALQQISMETDSFLSERENGMVILDGLDFMVANNGRDPVKRLLEVIHEKVIVSGGTLVFRVDSGMEEELAELMAKEADRIIPDRPKQESGKEESEGKIKPEAPAIPGEGSLDRSDLQWMCRVMGIPEEGTDSDLLARILEQSEEGERIKKEQVGKEDRLKSLMESAKQAREENENLLKKIDSLESKLEGKTKKRKKRKGRGMVLEWEGRKDHPDVEKLVKEVQKVREEVEGSKSVKYSTDPALIELLRRMEEERKENIKRLTLMEEVLREELEEIRKGLKESKEPSREIQMEQSSTEKLSAPRKKELPPSRKPIKKHKKKVLKKGKTAVAIIPKVGKRSALDSARKTIKRTLFRGPRERVDAVVPVYLPLYRFLIGYKGNIFRGRKEGDLYIDGILGEVICGDRGDLKRSKGLPQLLKMTDMETRIYRGIGGSRKEDLQISKKAGLPLKDTRRALTSLNKKGIVKSTAIEGDIKIFSLSDDIDIPRKAWCKDPDLAPKKVEGIEEPMGEPSYTSREVEKLIGLLSDDIVIKQVDTVMYPYYIAIIVGEGRERYVAIDGVSGKIDEDLSPSLDDVMKKMKEEG